MADVDPSLDNSIESAEHTAASTSSENSTAVTSATTSDARTLVDASRGAVPNAACLSQSMSPLMKLRRFCFVGTFEPVYVQKRDTSGIAAHLPELQRLCHGVNDVQMRQLLTSMLNELQPPRYDETLWLLAVYLSCDLEDIKWRTNLRKAFPSIVRSDKHFFMFIKCAAQLRKLQHHQAGFSRTERKAIADWYEAQTPESLVHMWTTRRRRHGYSHKQILKLCHVPDEKFEARTRALVRMFFASYTTVVKAAQLSHSNAADEVMRRDRQPDQPMEICLPVALLYTKITTQQALAIIKRYQLSYEQVPRHLMDDASIVAELIPQMNLRELLDCWRLFARRHIKNNAVFGECKKIFNNNRMLRQCNMHPVQLLLSEYKLGRRLRYEAQRNVRRLDVARMNYMRTLYYRSFGANNALGLRLHITLNLQDNYKNKKLFGAYKRMCYLEAIVGLAFGYFKSEDNARIFYWYCRQHKLRELLWHKDMNVVEAYRKCKALNVRSATQQLTTPIIEALNDHRHIYDLFLIIVPTGGRGNPNNESTQLCHYLDQYRMWRNSNAKLIIIDLRRNRKSMGYSKLRSENILELCGLNEHIPQLLHDFAHNRFE